MFVLEAIVCQMHHKLLLALHILLRIVLNCKSQVSRVEKCEAGAAIVEKIASDVKFFVIEQKRSDVVLDQTILLQVTVF